jgi:ABC-2 type transport system permease protein
MTTSRSALTGLGVFVKAFLRRDRWMMLWFAIGVTVLYWSQAASVDGLYKTQADFDKAAADMAGNTAFIAMAGPARALNTTGGQVTWQASAFGAIVVALMAMFLVGRHTRGEEESGRDELVRAAVVGRHAPATATLLVVGLASLVVGTAVTLSLVAYGLAAAGAVALGVGLVGSGLAFGALALLAAQLTSSVRATYGLTGAAIGVAYAWRAIGDVGNGALSWLSPIGWYQAMHAYSGERWWPLVLLAALAVVAASAAYALFDRRDLGAGILPARPGPPRAAASLGGPVGLPWRLQCGSVLGWAAGLFLGGLAYGSIGDDVGSLVGDSSFAKDVFGIDKGRLVDSFYATSALMLALIATGFAISSALRPRGEEADHRAEPVLTTALPRRTWLLGHLAVTLAGAVAIVALAGLGMGLGYAMVTGDGGNVLRFAGATLAMLPGVLVLAGVAVLLHGLVPRAASLAWLALVWCAVVLLFGTSLRMPSWLQGVSPFHHLAAVPADPVAWTPWLVVLAVGAALGALGVTAFTRRDVR